MATILTIDDSRLTHHVVRLALAKEGYTLVSARDGAEGLDVAQRVRPDAVILGRTLPVVDGVEVLRRLHDAHAGLQVIVIGAGLSEETRAACVSAGARAFLDRPIDALQLRCEIAEALGDASSRAAAA